MTRSSSTIAYLTAGAGGMYCGSCLHDNTLARALSRLGVDVQLIPTYTPIRTDEDNVSVDRVFFGGINIFLEQKIPLYRHLPSFVRGLLDQPWLIRWATSRASATSAKSLGQLTVSMLRGEAGNQRAELDQLCSWLAESVQPCMVNFSNVLIAGCAPRLKSELQVPLLVTLQGDDIFLEYLPEPYRGQALSEIRRLVDSIDGFLVHSRYYADFMRDYLSIPSDKLHTVPLGIDTSGFPPTLSDRSPDRAFTIGYLARLAPEKGLHVLVDAYLNLRKRVDQDVQLRIAGWLGGVNREYAEAEFEKLRMHAGDSWEYVGEVDRQGKIDFLQQLDVLSVPTTYREPKGLFVLEALAAGVPIVEPEHGAFPELIESLGGGRLVQPNDPDSLADHLHELLFDDDARNELRRRGHQAVHERFDATSMAEETWRTLQRFLH